MMCWIARWRGGTWAPWIVSFCLFVFFTFSLLIMSWLDLGLYLCAIAGGRLWQWWDAMRIKCHPHSQGFNSSNFESFLLFYSLIVFVNVELLCMAGWHFKLQAAVEVCVSWLLRVRKVFAAAWTTLQDRAEGKSRQNRQSWIIKQRLFETNKTSAWISKHIRW